MAGPYYVDIDSPGAWNGKTGLDTTTNALLGLSGLQYLIDTVTVGNGPIYVKGATGGDVAKLKTIASTTSLSGVFIRGEGVTWDAGASTGVVSEIAANAPTVIEVLTGTLANPDSLVGTTSGATCTVNGAIAQKGTGIDIDTNAGTYNGGMIKIIGCADDASYTINDTRAVINGNGAAAHVVQFTGTADNYFLRNIEAKNTAAGTYHGFYTSSAQSLGLVLYNCCGNTCGLRGFSFEAANAAASYLIRCVAYSNGGAGFYGGPRILFCTSRDNTTDGFNIFGVFAFGCVSHGNGDDGFDSGNDTSITLINCVSDGNTDDGIVNSAFSTVAVALYVGCRITNHSGSGDIGLNLGSMNGFTYHCYFEDNDGNNIQNDTLHTNLPLDNSDTTSNVEDQADTNEGYVDKTNHDFSTNYASATNPHARRTAITLPWS